MGLGLSPQTSALPLCSTTAQFKCHQFIEQPGLSGRTKGKGFSSPVRAVPQSCGPHFPWWPSLANPSVWATVDYEFSSLPSPGWMWSMVQGLGEGSVICLPLLSVPLLHPVWGGRRLLGGGQHLTLLCSHSQSV